MLDEFLLWLAEKERAEFIQAINNLNLIVDHTSGQRSVPIFAFVARQRNLQEFFPDKVFAAGEVRSWKYRLDASVSLPGGTGSWQVNIFIATSCWAS